MSKHNTVMNKNLLTIITFLIFISGYSQKVKFKELGYGLISSEPISKQILKNSPSKLHTTTSHTGIIKKTDSIPIEIGAQFAVFYKLKFKKDTLIPLNIIWSYPEGMKDTKGNVIKETSYITDKDTNYKTFSSYTLEGENELVKGTRVFKMYYLGKELYQKEFYLY